MELSEKYQPLLKIERLVLTQDHLEKIQHKDDSMVSPNGN